LGAQILRLTDQRSQSVFFYFFLVCFSDYSPGRANRPERAIFSAHNLFPPDPVNPLAFMFFSPRRDRFSSELGNGADNIFATLSLTDRLLSYFFFVRGLVHRSDFVLKVDVALPFSVPLRRKTFGPSARSWCVPSDRD